VQQTLGGGNLQVIPAQFLAAAPAVGLPTPAPLTQEQLQPIIAEAAARWRAAGIDPQRLAALDHLTFRVEDLPGNDLGMEADGVITIDRTADGYGWFVDPTPGDDSEFAPGAVDSPARCHVDLLSVVAHEMGHVLGYSEDSDDAGTVMSEDLGVGVRHLPMPSQAATSPAVNAPAATIIATASSPASTTPAAPTVVSVPTPASTVGTITGQKTPSGPVAVGMVLAPGPLSPSQVASLRRMGHARPLQVSLADRPKSDLGQHQTDRPSEPLLHDLVLAQWSSHGKRPGHGKRN